MRKGDEGVSKTWSGFESVGNTCMWLLPSCGVVTSCNRPRLHQESTSSGRATCSVVHLVPLHR